MIIDTQVAELFIAVPGAQSAAAVLSVNTDERISYQFTCGGAMPIVNPPLQHDILFSKVRENSARTEWRLATERGGGKRGWCTCRADSHDPDAMEGGGSGNGRGGAGGGGGGGDLDEDQQPLTQNTEDGLDEGGGGETTVLAAAMVNVANAAAAALSAQWAPAPYRYTCGTLKVWAGWGAAPFGGGDGDDAEEGFAIG